MRNIFIIQVIKVRRNGRRKKIKYVKQYDMRVGKTDFSADINLAHIYYTDSQAAQSCATWRENHPQHEFKVFAVNIVINQNYDSYE